MQQDWIGATAPGQFKDRIPPNIAHGGSAEDVRAWKHDRAAAAKVAGNSRASANDISAAIRNMEKWWADGGPDSRARAFEQQGEKQA